ncbi:PREDICTED: uncharacterized protein LOC109205556 [Nicotiana attenuata]|uniref:uncharacterized protein LOC109205556 n=1 Tax=Nicotiana attenuata TaxID=49451 RepID=UPI00090522F1|nr:PREDICTED: uncharacterized protein LOC109205556 [Nicotiana attenuata]
MKLALKGKSKLGFVDESCVKSMYKRELAEQWEKCNTIVSSWIRNTVANELMPSIVFTSNAKKVWSDFKKKFDRCSLTRIYHLWTKIATLKQGIDSIITYYSKMIDLWSESGRLRQVMNILVDESQAAFVPGRGLIDNVLLSHELIKSYGRRGISPRCMIKIDMQKAYDSIEWEFLEQVLTGLCFPEIFIGWIMECLKTISYSISINGSPTKPFDTKRGVRQGDPMSPLLFVLAMEGDEVSIQLLCDCFNKFSKASGLVANQSKSCMYFGGVPAEIQQRIIQTTGFTIGEIPFKYLGVPLSAKRLSLNQCQPLLDKMLGKIKQWTTKFLSYAGRLQLIKSVLIAIQNFWSQIFPLPKKIIQVIEGICRKFLWTGDTNTNRKALVAWEKMCRPKSKGGLNITNLSMWNRAALIKHLWNLCMKKDKLWIRWVHVYYIKGKNPWQVEVKQASWISRKILQAGKYIQEARLDIKKILGSQSYSIRAVYNQLRGDFPKEEWSRLICNNKSCPRWKFILYLAVQEKLYTKDRLCNWGLQVDPVYALCEQELESHQHIFFLCRFSAQVWEKLLTWIGIKRRITDWKEELKWAADHMKGKGSKTMLYRMCITSAVYQIWLERNRRIFQQEKRSSEAITRQIIQEIHCIGNRESSLREELQVLNFYP